MPYAEVIYETGAKSVVQYDSIDDLKGGLKEHHQRAIEGRPGASQQQTARTDVDPNDFAVMPSVETMMARPAERVHKVLLYDQHPGDIQPKVQADTLNSLIDGMKKDDGSVDQNQLIAAIRDEASPVLPVEAGRLESIYKAEPTEELDLSFLEAGE
jgi:hypothetical protein